MRLTAAMLLSRPQPYIDQVVFSYLTLTGNTSLENYRFTRIYEITTLLYYQNSLFSDTSLIYILVFDTNNQPPTYIIVSFTHLVFLGFLESSRFRSRRCNNVHASKINYSTPQAVCATSKSVPPPALTSTLQSVRCPSSLRLGQTHAAIRSIQET